MDINQAKRNGLLEEMEKRQGIRYCNRRRNEGKDKYNGKHRREKTAYRKDRKETVINGSDGTKREEENKMINRI